MYKYAHSAYAGAMKIGVVGASGYSGGELLRLLLGHPEFEISYIAAGSNAGEFITALHPHLIPFGERRFEKTEVSEINKCQLVFLALPPGESAKLVTAISPSTMIVDLGADFRLHDSSAWEKYYGGVHAGTWSYGMPEIKGNRSHIALATRIANPGCYATAIALSAVPAVSAKIIDSSDIVVVASSGTTGAGRGAKVNLLGSEVMNSLTSYKFGGVHQHTPEIEETLSALNDQVVKISFTPILAPMPRGILATVTAKLSPQLLELDNPSELIRNIYADYFVDEKFICLLPEGQLPRTSAVIGSNSMQIQIAVDLHSGRIIISAAIDNLGKGAAGQALQNANIMTGFDEAFGLSQMGTP